MRKIVNSTKPKIELTPSSPAQNDMIILSFKEFKLHSIKIDKRFNNHFRDEADMRNKLVKFLGTFLPWFTGESLSFVESNHGIRGKFHYHKLGQDKLGLLEDILYEYGYPQQRIDMLIDGANIYQFSPEISDSPRVIAEKMDNFFSILFWDVNHHLYFNEKYAGKSLLYEYCPIYNCGKCYYMKSGMCYAFDYLDYRKIGITLDEYNISV